MNNSNMHDVSKPSMPGKYDAIYAEIDLRDGYRAIAYDSDPYEEVTVLRGDTPLFTVLVGNHRTAMRGIEENIEHYLEKVNSL